jgi:tRNA(adenine34) deaminase
MINEESQSQIDERFMRQALVEAREAFDNDEVPVGAVVVSRGRIIGRGHNTTEALSDVTAHAEMIAITSAANTVGGKYLPDATLYVTVEPCLMCAGAIGWSQLRRIVIGAPDPKRGYAVQCRVSPFHPRAEVVVGVLEDECSTLMKTFFKRKR